MVFIRRWVVGSGGGGDAIVGRLNGIPLLVGGVGRAADVFEQNGNAVSATRDVGADEVRAVPRYDAIDGVGRCVVAERADVWQAVAIFGDAGSDGVFGFHLVCLEFCELSPLGLGCVVVSVIASDDCILTRPF